MLLYIARKATHALEWWEQRPIRAKRLKALPELASSNKKYLEITGSKKH